MRWLIFDLDFTLFVDGSAVTKNTRIVWLGVIGAVILAIVVLIGRDLFLKSHGTFDCGDGPRRTIDIRDFASQYSAYSLELEADVADKAKVSAKLTPGQLQQLSDAVQNSDEFRKYVVAGYNSCAITKAQYVQLGERFQTLDNLAHEIIELTKEHALSPEASDRVAALIKQYAEIAGRRSIE